jgi:hypothetical protein
MSSQVALILAGRAVQHAAGLVGAGMQHHHEHKLTQIRAAVVEMMTGKVTVFQLVTIKELGQFVLNLMAEEHMLFRQEYALDKAAYRATTDVVQRAELNSSIDKAATQMSRVREHATAFHSAIAMLLGRAAEQIMGFTSDISLRMPAELTAPEPLPVIDAVPSIPANDNDADDAEVSR